MSRVMVISDTHWGHKNICRFRPEFSSAEEHDYILTDNICSSLRKRDVLWLLGDCFFTKESINHLHKIRGHCSNVHWVLGNHDTDTNERQEIVRTILSRGGLIGKVGSMFKISKAWLTHHPLHPEELRGRVNIHGHVHRATIHDSNYLNVCCENVNYRPVNIQELLQAPSRVLNDYGTTSRKNKGRGYMD